MHRIFSLAPLLLLTACHTTPDYTQSSSATCEVHQVTMTKRTVPIAYGMIPMSKVEASQGKWHRRTTQYPHPGDCLPATSLNLHGEKRARVYVCPNCEHTFQSLSNT